MQGRMVHIVLFLLLAFPGRAQRMHLEVGGTVGFKDEFFLRPSFDSTSRFTEFHLFDLYAFSRVSKRRLGGELGLGFEKAGYYFVRHYDNTTGTGNLQINRLSVDLSGLFYLRKKAAFKWDVQAGVRSFFNLTTGFELPTHYEQTRWAPRARVTTNLTFKFCLVGIYAEHAIRRAYPFAPPSSVFGIRLGVIY